jgi:flagellar hook-basal body complex protein FliE
VALEPVGIAASYRSALQGETSATPASRETFATSASGGETFAAAVTRAVRGVNAEVVDASGKAADLVVRGEGTIHDAMIAADKAEGSFRLLMEMRNRLIEGVNRLLETQV